MVNYVTNSGATWGVLTDEVGLNMESVSRKAKPEFKEPLHSRDNTIRDWSIAPTALAMTLKGERLSTTTPFAANFYSACTVSNTHALMGSTGMLLLDDVTDEEKRDGWHTYEANMSSNAGVTAGS